MHKQNSNAFQKVNLQGSMPPVFTSIGDIQVLSESGVLYSLLFFTIHAILTSSCALCLYSCWRRELRDLSPEGHLEVGSASVRECCERRYKPCVLVFPEREKGLKKTQHRATILNKFIRPPFIKTKKTQIFKKSVKNEFKAKNHIVTYQTNRIHVYIAQINSSSITFNYSNYFFLFRKINNFNLTP